MLCFLYCGIIVCQYIFATVVVTELVEFDIKHVWNELSLKISENI